MPRRPDVCVIPCLRDTVMRVTNLLDNALGSVACIEEQLAAVFDLVELQCVSRHQP